MQDDHKLAPPVLGVAQDAPGKPRVRVRVDEELHVEQVADLGEVEDQDAFDEDDVRVVDQLELVLLPGDSIQKGQVVKADQ